MSADRDDWMEAIDELRAKLAAATEMMVKAAGAEAGAVSECAHWKKLHAECCGTVEKERDEALAKLAAAEARETEAINLIDGQLAAAVARAERAEAELKGEDNASLAERVTTVEQNGLWARVATERLQQIDAAQARVAELMEQMEEAVKQRDAAVARAEKAEAEHKEWEAMARRAATEDKASVARLREALPVLLKWVDNLSLFASIHGMTTPVQELVTAIEHARAALGETK